MNKYSSKRILPLLLVFAFLWGLLPAKISAEEAGASPYQKYELANEIMDNIAAGFTDDSGEWVIMDMAAYSALKPNSPHKTSEKALQHYINYAIGTVIGIEEQGGSTHSAYAKEEIILRSIGGDTDKLYAVRSNNKLDTLAKIKDKLKAAGISHANMYDAPWILLANLQGKLELSPEDIAYLIEVIGAEQPQSGIYGYTWDGEFYSDYDTTATIITALSAYYNIDTAANNIADKAIAGLSAEQNADGSFGSSNSDAVAVIALVSMGINPDTDSRFIKNGISLYDALLAYVNEDMSGFTFFGEANALSSEQGFRALIAAEQMRKTGKAFNIYDFSSAAVGALRAIDTAELVIPNEPAGEGVVNITLSLEAGGEYWIDSKELAVKQGSSVYHAFVGALKTGFSYEGAEKGYVRSVTNIKSGEELSEFDKGIDSGWLYKVNGEVPVKGFLDYILNDGDDIIWFFSDDYVRDTDKNEATLEAVPFSDVNKSHGAYDIIMKAKERNVITGIDNVFYPDRSVTKAEFLTMLYKLEAEPKFSSSNNFIDLSESDWYYSQVIWAYGNGIAADTGALNPAEYLNGQDMAVMLYRYLTFKGYDFGTGAESFTDHIDRQIIENSLANRENGLFKSNEEISRAEAIGIIILLADEAGI